ncbi:MAG: DUF4281 domain-containing protein [Brevundimonas sp.]|uniref:abscisic acid-deficient protein Aba4 family protein n=1 Tax=Brevundimonas sp. TaxID=1871086 RepID=UPI0025C5F509|nr:abscisic acid-deficient protein Aba4 family protein [Brevundimonas sp.]MBX3478308.1 DUF4281 domain-containing protein [Brevundimonas sp.]
MPSDFGAPDILYALTGLVIVICWAFLILHPNRSSRFITVPKFGVPLAFGLIYAGVMMAKFAGSGGGYGSIAEVRALFVHDDILLAGWLHYLAYDFFIGVWIAEQADRMGLSRQIQAVILVVAFMFPPMGLALFLITRGATHGLRRITA